MANDPRSFAELHSFAEKAAEQYAATQGRNPAQGMTPDQITQYNQQLWQGVANYRQYQAAQQRHMWMWNGTAMSIEDFAQHAYGDSPERTHFLLRYKDVI